MSNPVKQSAQTAQALLRYRLDVASRVLAATGLNYAICALFAVLVALAFVAAGMPRVDAVLAADMLAFLLFALVAVWVFACASAARMWAVLVLPFVVMAALGWYFQPQTQPAQGGSQAAPKVELQTDIQTDSSTPPLAQPSAARGNAQGVRP